MTSPTPTELVAEMFRLSQNLDKGLEYLLDMSREWAESESAYRRDKAIAYLSATGSARTREMVADEKCEKQRHAAYLARGQKEAAKEAVRARRTQISALQSALSAVREEMGFAKTGTEW